MRPGKRATERLHRAIMGLTVGGGGEVDHANGNKLDNRRGNLRLCTKSQNQWNKGIYSNNTSGFKGVSYDGRQGKWQARIRVGGKMRSLGYFYAPEQAHAAYCAAANELRGQFARTA
ncbi:HNH endonuclease [Cupriavidus necator]|uniref:HNH endonuclease n=1 Tax=Cupriavidus necator TaxID=106590 RepID=UPI003C6BF6A9